MLNTNQKADLLFKKSLGKGSSNAGDYYNEYLNTQPAVDPRNIWSMADSISIPAITSDTAIVQYIQDLTLLPIPGSTSSFYHPSLKDSIPFNFDPSGSYIPTLKTNSGATISFGVNDWIFDTTSGQVTFYNGVPVGVSDILPPKITCWKYIGPKGLSGPGILSKDFISGQVESPSVDNHYYLVNSSPVNMKILGLNIALWQGSGNATILVDSTPIPGLTNIPLNGMDTLYQASGSFGVSTGSVIILEMSNMSVNAGRTRFTLNILKETT
jgi:hypothetical protein